MDRNLKATDVFTPTKVAIATFVERKTKLNNHLVDSLETPGKQIVLYGHSGCGKSTLLRNKVDQIYSNVFITRCMDGMSFDSIILNGFEQLGKIYKKEDKTTKFTICPELSLEYLEIKGSLKLFEYSKENLTTASTFVPPHLTPNKLGVFFGEANGCWILEDFHKIKGDDKKKVSQLMKVFMDMSEDYEELKIIAIGAVGTARQVVEYDAEMNNRVAEIHVPYMSDDEIESIIKRGEVLLNLNFSKETKDLIIKYSCGLPSICHQICLNICFNKNVRNTSKIKISINVEDLDHAITKLIEEKSDSLKADFDKAIKVAHNSSLNVPQIILEYFLSEKKDEFTFQEVKKGIQNYNVSESKIEKSLKELCESKRSEILIFDENSFLYRFNNLFLKSYAYLRLKDGISNKDYAENRNIGKKDELLIQKLLEIINSEITEKIITDENMFYIDESYE